MSAKKKSWDFAIVQSWWVFLWILGCGIVYERIAHNLDIEQGKLVDQTQLLRSALKQAESDHAYLLDQVNSQHDPYWIERTLKRRLGLVAEGQIKVYLPSAGSYFPGV